MFIQTPKVVDTFKFKSKYQVQVQPMMLTHDARQRYVLRLNLILALEL